MPDLATDPSLGNDTVVVAYAPLLEIRTTGTGLGKSYNFDLLACVIDYSQGGAPQVSTPQILDTNIGFDLYPDGNGGTQEEVSGGKILPDCVFDSQGHLVLVYENSVGITLFIRWPQRTSGAFMFADMRLTQGVS